MAATYCCAEGRESVAALKKKQKKNVNGSIGSYESPAMGFEKKGIRRLGVFF